MRVTCPLLSSLQGGPVKVTFRMESTGLKITWCGSMSCVIKDDFFFLLKTPGHERKYPESIQIAGLGLVKGYPQLVPRLAACLQA